MRTCRDCSERTASGPSDKIELGALPSAPSWIGVLASQFEVADNSSKSLALPNGRRGVSTGALFETGFAQHGMPQQRPVPVAQQQTRAGAANPAAVTMGAIRALTG